MVYMAAGILGSPASSALFLKDYLGLSAAFLAGILGFWAGIPGAQNAVRTSGGSAVALEKACWCISAQESLRPVCSSWSVLIGHREAMIAVMPAEIWYVAERAPGTDRLCDSRHGRGCDDG